VLPRAGLAASRGALYSRLCAFPHSIRFSGFAAARGALGPVRAARKVFIRPFPARRKGARAPPRDLHISGELAPAGARSAGTAPPRPGLGLGPVGDAPGARWEPMEDATAPGALATGGTATAATNDVTSLTTCW
jgi:hypothetical protein